MGHLVLAYSCCSLLSKSIEYVPIEIVLFIQGLHYHICELMSATLHKYVFDIKHIKVYIYSLVVHESCSARFCLFPEGQKHLEVLFNDNV